MAPPLGTLTLARIDLGDCPFGAVLDPNEPDRRVEEQFLSGWTNPLAAPPRWRLPGGWRVVPDGERRALEHPDKSDRCLVTGDLLWSDYAVEAHVRQLSAHTRPGSDEPRQAVARTGLMLRYQDLRQYYLFCLEGLKRIALYYRRDDAWTLLAEEVGGVERGRYYHLEAVCQGSRIECRVDGRLAFVAWDDRLPMGKAGVRTNTRGRFHGVRVATTPAGQATFASRLSARQREVAEVAERYPKPVLWKRLDISEWWPCQMRYGDFRGAGAKEIVLQRATEAGPRIVCLDLEGQVTWDRCYRAARPLQRTVMHDLDGDGAEEFIGIDGERLVMVSGRTGDVVAQTQLPPTGPYHGPRGASVARCLHSLRPLWPCRIRRTPGAQDLLLRDGDGGGSGYSLWAYDEQLQLRWRQDAHGPLHGMYLWFCDVDGDGRDEILPGYELLDGDGNRLWTMEGAQYLEDTGGGGHVDHAAFGELDGDESNGPEIGLAGSDEGFFLVHARTGQVRANHRCGHAQGIYAGNFRPDLPGLEMWVGDRWGTYGILNLVSGRGEPLARCEPDNLSQGGPAVNWTGDGEELLLIQTSPEAFGLYDARGRKVVVPVCEGLPFSWESGIVEDMHGDARDEITYVHDGAIYVLTQDQPYRGERIYAPTRRMDISLPGWKDCR
ncbi:MAG: hypothetical protein AB1505_02660 [Candidatus Latescibacterota bacterium]